VASCLNRAGWLVDESSGWVAGWQAGWVSLFYEPNRPKGDRHVAMGHLQWNAVQCYSSEGYVHSLMTDTPSQSNPHSHL